MSPFKSVTLPMQSAKSQDCIYTKTNNHSVRSRQNSNLTSDSRISVDSDTGTAIQETHPPFILRVVNPDIEEEEDDDDSPVDLGYTPTTSDSLISSPEIKPSTTQQQQQSSNSVINNVPPSNQTQVNSWKLNNPEENLSSTMNKLKVTDQKYNPTVIRKESKTLVEQPIPLMSKNKGLELLPPLDFLPPLFFNQESHLLSPLTETNETPSPTTSQISSHTPPPQLPQHQPDLLIKKEASSFIAQQADPAAVQNDVSNNHEKPNYTMHQRNSSLTPSLTPSSIYSTQAHQQHALNSRYSKASYSLTNNPEALKLYKKMAIKTNDPVVQLTYAKYLLEIASLYDDKKRPDFRPSLTLPGFSKPRRDSFSSNVSSPDSVDSQRSSLDTRISVNTAMTFNPLHHDSASYSDETLKRKKKKMLEDEGVAWIQRLAKKNVGEAAYLLASWYERGIYGFRKSPSKSRKYYEIAANDKVPEAMFAVALIYEREQDYMTSFQLYEEAAGLGLVEAYYRIAMINLNGEFGSRKNTVAAIHLLMKASESTNGTCPEAPFTLGLLLLNDYNPDVNIPSDLIQTYGGTFAAITYLEYASEMNFSPAQFKLGSIYEHGLFGYRVNLTKAYAFYELAANTNNYGPAMLGLSRIYNQGVKLPPEQLDEQLAIFEQDESHWIKNHLRDEDLAFRWCQLAANQNIPDANYLLGWYYENGIGVPRDFEQAHRYYNKAVKKGKHKEAADRIQLLETLVKQRKKKGLHESILGPNNSPLAKSSRESQCQIM